MAKFLSDLVVEVQDNRVYVLTKPLIYISDIPINGKYTIIVPEGFVTDFASVPRLPFAYLLAGGIADKAAVVHDYLYEYGIGSKDAADRIFLEAMTILNIPTYRRYPMYWAVCVGGKGNFIEEEAVQ